MKVIFLDIDGVMNSELFYVSTKGTQQTDTDSVEDWRSRQIDPSAVAMLNKLCEETDSRVVISSSWRSNMDIEQLQDLFNGRGATFKIIGETPPCACRNRGCEIKQWLNEARRKHRHVDNYIIFDDDSDMLLEQQQHFFQTDGYCGLTPNLVYRAKRFLNNQI